MTELVDRSGPGVRITVLSNERAPSGEPLNLDGRIIGKFGHAGKRFEADALEGIDIGFLTTVGGDRLCQLPGGIPADGALLGEKLGQITEQGHALEGIASGVRFARGDVGGIGAHGLRLFPRMTNASSLRLRRGHDGRYGTGLGTRCGSR